jgi:hypothetical protein
MTDRLSYAPKEIPAVTGIAFTRVREAIDSGALPARYSSPKRQIVLHEDLQKWLLSLPTEQPTEQAS